jgi:hypothetical protein
VLSAGDEHGRPLPVARGSVPNFHSFRHTAASEAIAAGESVEEVSWQLGHRNSNVTRAVYVQEVKSAERSARRRTKLGARYRELTTSSAPPRTGREKPTASAVVPLSSTDALGAVRGAAFAHADR